MARRTGRPDGVTDRNRRIRKEKLAAVVRDEHMGTHVENKKWVKTYLRETNYVCSECGISDWNGKPLTLEIDHVDGDRTHNRLSNCRLLCPNCHSQTVTFKGRNKRLRSSVGRAVAL